MGDLKCWEGRKTFKKAFYRIMCNEEKDVEIFIAKGASHKTCIQRFIKNLKPNHTVEVQAMKIETYLYFKTVQEI